MIKLNKRGMDSGDAMFWAIFIMVFGFTSVVFASVLNSFSEDTAKIPENLEPFLLTQRFFYSPACFTYKDDVSGRSFSNIIDFDKFNGDSIDNCYNIDAKSRNIAFRLSLKMHSKNLEASAKTANWDDAMPIKRKEPEKDVLVYYDDKIYNGEISIEVQKID